MEGTNNCVAGIHRGWRGRAIIRIGGLKDTEALASELRWGFFADHRRDSAVAGK